MLKITKGGHVLRGAVREDFSVVLTYKLRSGCWGVSAEASGVSYKRVEKTRHSRYKDRHKHRSWDEKDLGVFRNLKIKKSK